MGTRPARGLVALSTGLAGLALLGQVVQPSPPALADPPGDERKIERRIDSARADLHLTTARLEAATEAVRAAQATLSAARSRLAAIRGKLAAARARDTALAKQLAHARAALASAQSAVAAARSRVVDQRERIALFANASYQGSSATEIVSVLGSRSIGDLLTRAQIVVVVSDSQRTVWAELQAAQAALAGVQVSRRLAEQAVATKRAEAARNLARMRTLERQARRAEKAVERLLEQRRAARAEARRARLEDLRRYRALLAERERIRRLLRASRNRRSGSAGDLGRPVDGPITSPYGMRFHPILRVWKLHDGTDFGASCGTPVRAAAAGEVIARYYNAGYGNRLLIAHGSSRAGSLVTAYNHLSGYAAGDGERVAAGEVVGYVGTTGYSTGCHLHFMVYVDGRTVDPMTYLD